MLREQKPKARFGVLEPINLSILFIKKLLKRSFFILIFDVINRIME
jgi:hypothetical protein